MTARPAPPDRRPRRRPASSRLPGRVLLLRGRRARRRRPRADRVRAAPAALAEAPELRLGYFANVTHAVAARRRRRRHLPEGAGRHEAHHRRSSTPARPPSRRCSAARSTRRSSARTPPSTRSRSRTARRSASSPARPPAARSSSSATASTTPSDLKGKTLATPQLGNTQDVALRAWLADQDLKTSLTGGASDVTIVPQENSQTLDLFKAGQLDGAWLPEPWASRLVVDAGAHVLVDEKDLWPDGDFVTTHLIVSTEFLDKYPGTVKKLLEAEYATTEWITANPDEAKTAVEHGDREAHRQAALRRRCSTARGATCGSRSTRSRRACRRRRTTPSRRAPPRRPTCTGIYDLTLLNEVLAGQRPGAGRRRRARGVGQVTTTATAAGGPGIDCPGRRRGAPDRRHAALRRGVAPAGARPHRPDRRARRVRLPARRLRLRQVDAAVAGRRARQARRPAPSRCPGGRPALMFQEPALYPWLTAGANVELALRLRGVPAPSERERGPAPARARPARGRRPQAGARAVRRHAPARRAGPRAGPGGRPPAHGRAVRGARRDHPRRAARGAHPHLDRDRPRRHLRHAQRARGGAARAAGRPALVAARPGGARVARRHPAAAPHRGPRRVRGSAPRSPRTCERRSPAMATETRPAPRHAHATDRRRPRRRASTRSRPRSSPRAGSAWRPRGARSGPCSPRSPPCSSCGRSPTCSSSSRRTRCPARPTPGRRSSAPIQDGSAWRAVSTSVQRAAVGFVDVGRRRRRDRDRARRLAAAAPRVRPDHHRPAVAAVGRLGARRDHLVRAHRRDDVRGHPARRGAVDRQRAARRDRPGAAAVPARRPGARRHAAGRGSGYVLLPAALPGFLGGLKQGWAFAWRSLMAAELITSRPGSAPASGSSSTLGRATSDMSLVIASIFLIFLVGIVDRARRLRAARARASCTRAASPGRRRARGAAGSPIRHRSDDDRPILAATRSTARLMPRSARDQQRHDLDRGPAHARRAQGVLPAQPGRRGWRPDRPRARLRHLRRPT